MKVVKFHSAAEAEMQKAAAYYESQQRDLGRRFLVCIQDAINRIALNPQLYPIVDDNVRRCLARTFPFGVLFRDCSDSIQVIAVMHLHREPHYWETR